MGRLRAERMRVIVTHVKPNYLAPAPSPRLPHPDSAKSAWNAAGPDLDHRLTTSPVLPYFTRRDGACVERAPDGPFHNRAVPWQRASARSFALHGQSVWLTSDQLSPTCCKIVSTTIQCAIDNAEKTIATGAPGGAQAAIWTLIASSFQNLPLARHANRKFILIFGIVQWHVSGSRHCGTALTS